MSGRPSHPETPIIQKYSQAFGNTGVNRKEARRLKDTNRLSTAQAFKPTILSSPDLFLDIPSNSSLLAPR